MKPFLRKYINVGIFGAVAVVGSGVSQEAAGVTVAVSADTYITENSGYGGPTSTHGADPYLYAVRGSGGYRTFSLLKFDLSSYAGGTVVGATPQLALQLVYGFGGFASESVTVRESLVNWNESTASFSNFGGSGFNEATQTGPDLSSQFVTFSGAALSVPFSISSSLIQKWINTPSLNFGLILVTNETANGRDLVFSSREGSVAPTLTFNTVTAAVPEPSTYMQVGLGLLLLPLLKLGRRKLAPKR